MKTLKKLYTTAKFSDVEEKKSPAEIAQQRRKQGRMMAKIAKKASTKIKKKRALTRKRDLASLQKSAAKQAKMLVIKKQLGDVKYSDLPIQKRIQIDQKIVMTKAKVIQKITKKILRKLKAGEGERVKKNREAQKAAK